MDKKIKLRGQLRMYLQWTLLMAVIFVVMSLGLFTINTKAALIASVCTIFYIIVALVLFFRSKIGRAHV